MVVRVWGRLFHGVGVAFLGVQFWEFRAASRFSAYSRIGGPSKTATSPKNPLHTVEFLSQPSNPPQTHRESLFNAASEGLAQTLLSPEPEPASSHGLLRTWEALQHASFLGAFLIAYTILGVLYFI